MDLMSLSDKQLHEMERLVTELASLMSKAKLTDDPLYEILTKLKYDATELRQKRFDEGNPRFQGY